jgi:anti-sigma factor RsiW
MNLKNCKNLDAYVSDDLPDDGRTAFEFHLERCSACHDAVDQQQWIDALLQSPVRLQLEPVRIELSGLPRTLAANRIKRVQLAACGLAAAAMLLVAVGRWELNRPAVGRIGGDASHADVAEVPHVRIATTPPSTFVASADVIAVPIKSHHPDVTIVRVYQTYQPNYAAQVSVGDKSNEFIRPDYPTEVNNGT